MEPARCRAQKLRAEAGRCVPTQPLRSAPRQHPAAEASPDRQSPNHPRFFLLGPLPLAKVRVSNAASQSGMQLSSTENAGNKVLIFKRGKMPQGNTLCHPATSCLHTEQAQAGFYQLLLQELLAAERKVGTRKGSCTWLVWFGGHTQWTTGLTPDSVLRSHSWWAVRGPHRVLGIESGPVLCKAPYLQC